MLGWLEMRPAWWLVALAGCDRIFGLSPTQLPPPDAPYACPAIGSVPAFSPVLHQSVFQFCDYLSVSADTNMAMAECFEPRSFVGYAPRETELVPVPDAQIPSTMRYPKLSPEGDQAFLYDPQAGDVTVFALTGDTWALASAIPQITTATFSAPTRAPRHLLTATYNPNVLNDLIESGGVWTVHDSYAVSLLGVDDIEGVSITPDGLRVIYYATPHGMLDYKVLYSDRATVDDRFGPGTVLDPVPPLYDVFITYDCSRIYFSSSDLQQVLYIEQ